MVFDECFSLAHPAPAPADWNAARRSAFFFVVAFSSLPIRSLLQGGIESMESAALTPRGGRQIRKALFNFDSISIRIRSVEKKNESINRIELN
mmetsp:Transcript_8544/g.18021  ORF Transcript_8544/g.18021 Transcript_8544/m.18021 type:complete len:93 (-) Transcript_8544:176-454(-)